MSATLPKTVPSENGLRRLPGVVLFPAGEHTDMHGRREAYTPEYVERLARESEALRTGTDFRLEPPAVLGHEIDQSTLRGVLSADAVYQKLFADGKITSGGGPGSTDRPAAGWPTNLRFERNALVGDLDRIPPSVADKIDAGEYRYPSVEIKRGLTKPDGSRVDALWRVALLGGTPPACRNVPPFGDTAAFADVVYFTDAAPDAPPDKPVLTLLQKVYKFLSSAFLSSLTRPQVDQLAADAAAAMGDPSNDPVKRADNPGVIGMSDANNTLSDADRKAVVADLIAAFADPQTTPAALKPQVEAAKAEIQATLAAAKAQADASAAAVRAFAEAEDRRRWEGVIDATVDRALARNAIPRAEDDKNNPRIPPLRQRLRGLIGVTNGVVEFADGDGTKKLTLLEQELALLDGKTTRKFGDQVPDKAKEPDPLADLEARSKKYAEDQNRRAKARA